MSHTAQLPVRPHGERLDFPSGCGLLDLAPTQQSFTEGLRRGLGGPRKAIPPQFLYDAAGTRLFNRICETPEYYVTRAEIALLRAHACAIGEQVGPLATVIEFGAGSEEKALLLLRALRIPLAYAPIDVSMEALVASAQAAARQHPDLAIYPIRGSFLEPPTPPLPEHGRRVAFFPGSTIGNLTPEGAVELLRLWRPALREDGLMLVGVDLRKHPAVFQAAYDDAGGATEAFIRNILTRANREAGADFDQEGFRYVAEYDGVRGCMQMALESRRAQVVRVAGLEIGLEPGERIHIEDSWKYSIEGFHAVARRAGYEPWRTWTDPQALFSLHLLGV